MNPLARQFGASLISWLVVLVVAGFAFTMGVRLFPVYLHGYTVKSIVTDVAEESRGTGRNPEQIWSSMEKRLDINDIDNIKRENFSYKKDRGVITIGIKYEDRTKLIGNLDAVVKFDYVETMPEEKDE